MRGAEMESLWRSLRRAALLGAPDRLGAIASAFALDLQALNGAGFAARRAAVALSDMLVPLARDPGDEFDCALATAPGRPAGFLLSCSCPVTGEFTDLFAFAAAPAANDRPGWLRQAGAVTMLGSLGLDDGGDAEALVFTHPLGWLRHWIAAQWAAFGSRCDLAAIPGPETCAAFVPDVRVISWRPDFNSGRGPRGLAAIRIAGDRAAAEHVAARLAARPPAQKTKLILVKGDAA